MPEPVLTSLQWKDWAAASLPPSPSLRSLMLQLNHALSNPEVAGHAEILIIFWKAERDTPIFTCLDKAADSVLVSGAPHSTQLSHSSAAVGAGLPLLVLCWVLCPLAHGPWLRPAHTAPAAAHPTDGSTVIFWV